MGSTAVSVRPGESVAGLAWLAESGKFVELCVVGKLAFMLQPEGRTTLMTRPELPGRNQGVGAPEELDAGTARALVVHGPRAEGGKVVLRRGPNPLAEATFAVGNDPVRVELSSTMHTTAAGRRGDEWLVVEAGAAASGRRWCKLPQLGILARWGEIEQLLLTSRVCLVDVSTWVVAFVLRASRKLPAAMAPSQVSLSLIDLSAAVQEREPLAAAPAPVAAPPTDDDDGGRTRVRSPGPGSDPGRPPTGRGPALEDSFDEPKTRFVDVASQLPKEALRDPRDVPAQPRRPSSAGLRIGRTSSPGIPAVTSPPHANHAAPAGRAIHDEPTTRPLEPEPAPSSVTRAFAALSPEARPSLRGELVTRVKEGSRLDDLDLRGADLAGVSLAGATLGGLDLTGADLSGADLMGADLGGARLDRARLESARLEGADLMCASLVGASLRGCSIAAANFAGADLTGADVTGASPVSSLAGAKFG